MNYFKTEKILITIGAIIFMLMGLGILLIGSFTPIEFNINGDYFTATYWEVANISMGGFWLWTIFWVIPCVIGLMGMICWFSLKKTPKKSWGVVLIVMGVISIFSLAGILYLVAGIMVINSKYWREKKVMSAGLKVD
ncbi:DUF4064 domain-containing protein [Listeria cossartiae subsp. cayugensis]|uniref:DUF4064 domain-containing protein n=1 Tax=Listeria cossartiae TaxID=2838249 RepID=UPI002880128B|nr:DUF4064 domain-containing protein [Listeria cossartiae]MDT0000743.1 DUF4064 domain-containing protein [Listeria cossartiae subsp. cayugensis]MDT0009153.1 DUF4064 domain-containing protein [Listeria cossartiae subsp. cayugensis]MDT0030985.1 DUF4064 domain-containing protein [Listeria cossartiae subsp. cayugensis]MDT0039100.1 DUF4064 domain-containing protein [Listeria cossartiae subsp. cayugensis]MDT0044240.1 DUF4064 domain-containing protein [Listeria cossartiae subsp. cayugensis]